MLTQRIVTPNLFGELLRELCFEHPDTTLILEPKKEFKEEYASIISKKIKDLFAKEGITTMKILTNNEFWVAFEQWHDDDAPELIVSDGNRYALNHDYRKDYGWKFVGEQKK